jgi:hypothetical protein
MTTLSGGCFCGAVRYEIMAGPVASMVCHCHTCRRISAAPVMGWVTASAAAFRYTEGLPRVLQSSPPVRRCFCGECGTHLTYEHESATGYVDVSTCSLDDPEAAPPSHHSWLSHNIAWVKFGDGLPEYPRSRTG